MAPLDTGAATHTLRLADPFGRGPGPALADFQTLGSSLHAIREHKGLSLAQVADATRVRLIYLAAIEQGDLAILPSRPFAVGYVRAYARTLGLDGDAAVARFKAEHPDLSGPLRAPVGFVREHNPRRRVIYAGLAVVLAAVALWNVAQRTLITEQASGVIFAPSSTPGGAQAWPEPANSGPLELGAPTPPPADQTTPEPYMTPGLAAMDPDPRAAPLDSASLAPSVVSPAVASVISPPKFTARGAVFGVPAKLGGVVVQAKKSASLVIRGAGGAIFFARELQSGQAYRAAIGQGLTADVSDARAFDVYVNGQLQGPLQDPQTPLDKLAASPVTPPVAPSGTAPPPSLAVVGSQAAVQKAPG